MTLSQYIAKGVTYRAFESSRRYDEIISYNKNSAPLSLVRYGKNNTNQYTIRDALSYRYNGNQLVNVSDTCTYSLLCSNSFEFVNGNEGLSETEYTYDGNGIKLGGNGSGGSSAGVHYAYNCIAFGCDKSGSVKGFDCNSHKDGHVLIGCLAFDNGYDFMFESGGSTTNTFFYNNVCLGRQEICVGSDNYNAINTTPSKNAWTNHLLTGVNKDGYISLDEEDALLPRSIDGSFPRKFGRLAADSKMVDAGSSDFDIPVGTLFDPLRQIIADYPFLKHDATGKARDLGPYERPADTTGVISVNMIEALHLLFGITSQTRS